MTASILLQLALSLALVIISWIHGWPDISNHHSIQDIEYSHGILSTVYFSCLALFCINYVYILYRDLPKTSAQSAWRASLIASVVASFGLVLNTGDFFSYLQFARLWSIYGLNPASEVYSSVHDSYSSFVWFQDTSNYGPLSHLVLFPAAWLSELSIPLGLIAVKMTWLGLGLLCLFQLKTFFDLKNLAGRRWFLAFSLNPFWLLEVFINAHNDILIVLFLLLLGIQLLKNPSSTWKTAFYASLLPLIKLPLGIVIAYLSFTVAWRKKGRSLLIYLSAGSLALSALFLFLGNSSAVLKFFKGSMPLSSQSFIGRIGWLLQTFEGPTVVGPIMAQIVPLLGVLGASFILLLLAVVSFSERKTQAPLRGLSWCLWSLVYLIGTQFWPWYALWILAFAILWQNETFFKFYLINSFASLIIYSSAYWQVLLNPPSDIIAAWPLFIPILGLILSLLVAFRLMINKNRQI
jgi:hypothetical protein